MKLLKQPAQPAEQRRVMLRAYSALVELRQGRGMESEWQDVADALNLVEALVQMGKISQEIARVVINGEKHMVAAMKNFRATGRMTLQPSGVKVLAEIVGEYDRAVQRLAMRTLLDAAALVKVRMATRAVEVVA